MNTRMAHLAVVSLTAAALVLSSSSPAEARRGKASASKRARVKTPAPGFLKAFTSKHENLLVTFDLVPHLRLALKSASVNTLQGLLKGHYDEDFDVQDLVVEMNASAPKIPAEVAVGLTDGGIVDGGRIVQGVILGLLADQASKAGDLSTLSQAHERLTKVIKGGGLDGLVLYARLHSEAMAKGVMADFVGSVRVQAVHQKYIDFDISDDSVGAVIHLGRAMSEAEATAFFVEAGVVPSAEHPATSALVGALRSVKQTIWFDRIGAGMRLTFGKRSRRARALRPRKLGASYRATPQDILWSRWTAKPWAKVISAWADMVSKVGDTPAWHAMMKTYDIDTSELGLSTLASALNKGEFGRQGDSRLWATDGVLHGVARAEGVAKPVVLSKSPLAAFIPSGETMVLANTIHSIETTLGSLADLLPTQLIPGDDEEGKRVETLRDRLTTLLSKGAGEVFVPGGLFLVGWGGEVDTLSVVRAEEDGTQQRIEGKRLPNYGIALSFPLASGADGLGFGARALDAIGAVLCANAGGTLPVDSRLTRPVKLGLGTPTISVPWDALTACQVGKSTTQIELSGDLVLHAFQLGDALILSSSEALSVRMATTFAGAHSRYELPKPGSRSRGKLVGFGAYEGDALAAWIGSFAQWVERLDRPNAEDDQEMRAEVIDAIQFAASSVRLIDRIQWTSTHRQRKLATRSQVSFR